MPQPNRTNSTIKGVLAKASSPHSYQHASSKGVTDFYKLGIKTESGKRILVTLSTTQMGWSGNLTKSCIYYHNKKNNRLIKTTMANPERFIGQKVVIRGQLETLDAENQKYRISHIEDLIFYLD
ncbi:hypothetical protein [Candidatus Lokiarchaeum ossiferum]